MKKNRLAQFVANAKQQKVDWYDNQTLRKYDVIAQPDGQLHPNTEKAILAGCDFFAESAMLVWDFYYELLTIPREGGGRKPFRFIDWWFDSVFAQLFGWKRADGRRRFDKGFITTAKKSGKSSTLAGLPLYMMTADNEEEAECISAAVDRDWETTNQ